MSFTCGDFRRHHLMTGCRQLQRGFRLAAQREHAGLQTGRCPVREPELDATNGPGFITRPRALSYCPTSGFSRLSSHRSSSSDRFQSFPTLPTWPIRLSARPPSPQNPEGFPVGFAKDTVTDVNTGQTVEVVGLTCAACHTGQLSTGAKESHRRRSAATLDLASFQTELGYAVAFTDKIPFRFDRFARAVLGENASSDGQTKAPAGV